MIGNKNMLISDVKLRMTFKAYRSRNTCWATEMDAFYDHVFLTFIH